MIAQGAHTARARDHPLPAKSFLRTAIAQNLSRDSSPADGLLRRVCLCIWPLDLSEIDWSTFLSLFWKNRKGFS